MPDMEKVLKGLEICYCPPAKCEDCPYHDLPDEQSCNDTLCLDALALLKEHEKEVQFLNDRIRYRDAIIEEYKKADGFLAAHGWRWRNNGTADT